MHPQYLFRQMEHERFLQDTLFERRLAGDEAAAAVPATSLRAWLRAALERRA